MKRNIGTEAVANIPRPQGITSIVPDDGPFEPAATPNRAVSDHYRCPEGFLNFQQGEKLSDDPGYFYFGADIRCYGRTCAGSQPTQLKSTLYNVIDHTRLDDGGVRLPFDPTEVIDNLRLERYVDSPGGLQKVLRRLYYVFRPLTTLSLRKKVQQFHARSSSKISFPHWPVDTTVETLCERLLFYSLKAKDVERVPFVWFWPDGARGCMTMTHDVETAAGRDFCGELMNLDDSAGVKASFQIVPQQRYVVSAKFLGSIRSRGFEVGVQDLNHDGKLFDSREEFVRRARVISQYGREYGARGFRAAVLYRKPQWFDMLNFAYDMSIPNVAHLDPQRGGCCTVMPFFIGNILEVPVTTTQDYTLFYILQQRSIDLWKTQTEMILAKNGMVSFIVHPDYLLDPELKALYLELLQYLRSLREMENLWFALPSEIECWWRARSKMLVKQEGDTWRVVGEGSERAVLAFAHVEGGRLVYKLQRPAQVSRPQARQSVEHMAHGSRYDLS